MIFRNEAKVTCSIVFVFISDIGQKSFVVIRAKKCKYVFISNTNVPSKRLFLCINSFLIVNTIIFFTQFIRISATVPDDNIKDHLLGMWPDDNLPELVITFLGGCDESVISEEVKESLKDCLTKVSKLLFYFDYFLSLQDAVTNC